MEKNKEQFFLNVSELLEKARKNVKTAVNLSMVYTYFEIGRMIFEEEQNGEQRASYGKYLMNELSEYLTAQFGKGFSVTNLKQMRQFYVVYSGNQISQTVSDRFSNLPTVSTGRKFFLSWSHYRVCQVFCVSFLLFLLLFLGGKWFLPNLLLVTFTN